MRKKHKVSDDDYESTLSQQTIPQLKDKLTEHGLKKTGNKADLIKRLCDFKKLDQHAVDYVGNATEAPQRFKYIMVRTTRDVKCRKTNCSHGTGQQVKSGHLAILNTSHTFTRQGEKVPMPRRSAWYYHISCLPSIVLQSETSPSVR